MKMLVIGATYAWPLFQIVESAVNNGHEVCIFDYRSYKSIQETMHHKEKIINFYKKHNIKCYYADDNLGNGINIIKGLGIFDICHIVYVFISNCYPVIACLNQFHTLILNYLGTDFYLDPFTKQFMLQSKKSLLDYADFIIVDTRKILNDFLSLAPQYQSKIDVVHFKTYQLEVLKNKITQDNKRKSKQNEKLTICCCNNATVRQQHWIGIRALAALKESDKRKIKVIFLMTYGYNSIPDYKDKIAKKMKEIDIEYNIIDSYLSHEELADLRKNIDILLHLIVADARSGALYESLYAGSVVIKGDWLNYPELEKENVFYISVKNEEDLTKKLSYIINDYDYYKEKSKNNYLAVDAANLSELYSNWNKFYISTALKKIDNQMLLNTTNYIFDDLNIKLQRKEQYRALLEKWLLLLVSHVDFAAFFIEKGYSSILIYGYGTLGKILKMTLDTKLQIFISDKEKLNIPNYISADLIDNTMFQCIVVTPLYSYNSIKKLLVSQKVDKNKIISLNKLVDEIEKWIKNSQDMEDNSK